MAFKNIHTAFFLFLMAGFSYLQSAGQSHTSVYNSNYWKGTDNEISKDQILSAIESLKRAEASIADSSIALKLENLGYLSIAKSGFTNKNIDKYGRKGWWMLSYPVALKYGLEVNNIIDERLDIQKSTLAAFSYLEDLKNEYKEDNMAELVFLESLIAVTKYNHDSINYPQKYNEIRNVEHSLLQVKQIYSRRSLEKYVGPFQPISAMRSNQKISFEAIHHFLQIPTSELKALNPQWISNHYDPLYGELLLPTTYRNEFEKQLVSMEQKTRNDKVVLAVANEKRLKHLKGNIPDLERYKPIRYKVKMGDNLGRISQKYHVKISSIRAWNELKNDRIYAGQRLTIYIPKNQKVVASTTPKKAKRSKLKTGDYKEYTVKIGDTLWGISQQFGSISTDIIMEDNGIDEKISPGQVLKIRKVE